ncbi:hypothetical protein B4073_1329 [Bacillus subtilis]|uniref:Uncharacterized protein n=1 Tax=Bacillus subtilis subsp. subtilis TaxID=135461 RepID=A0ABD4A075_BACIU|nr:hypothetical protein B4067_1501 [Bacillus subtilis subsp. subtilis]KIN32134.1 hypothetical protein B4069_1363 [Bacillus subtilis]KIN36306.1 hypothetical protein B4068_1306 [Bacillus subtilis]KIN41673.1 hypothetical protein B4070_1377 [Bacillus subtilis]KIN43543.1 hypothetical protein B4071_1352 [Bacillus subtilis]
MICSFVTYGIKRISPFIKKPSFFMLSSGFKGVASYYMKKTSARTEPFEAF